MHLKRQRGGPPYEHIATPAFAKSPSVEFRFTHFTVFGIRRKPITHGLLAHPQPPGNIRLRLALFLDRLGGPILATYWHYWRYWHSHIAALFGAALRAGGA